MFFFLQLKFDALKNASLLSVGEELIGALRNTGIIPGNVYVIKNVSNGNTTRLMLNPSK